MRLLSVSSSSKQLEGSASICHFCAFTTFLPFLVFVSIVEKFRNLLLFRLNPFAEDFSIHTIFPAMAQQYGNPSDVDASLFVGQNPQDGEHRMGTTILAVAFDGGVIMGADSRTSTGTYVANRVSNKLTKVHDRVYCCRSGSAADTQAVSDIVRYYLDMHR